MSTALLVTALLSFGDPALAPAPTPWAAFADVVKVLQHPRCMNCHPDGDAPLQTDKSRPHHMLITRASPDLGLPCASCHRDKMLPGPGMPPGVPNWHMPPKETPMVFQNRTPAALCEQLKDKKQNGGKTLAELVHHVENDPLVKYGWAPGATRKAIDTKYALFVARMRQWADAGGPCAP